MSLPLSKKVYFDKAIKANNHFGDKLNKLKEYNLRIFYLNINGLESDKRQINSVMHESLLNEGFYHLHH